MSRTIATRTIILSFITFVLKLPQLSAAPSVNPKLDSKQELEKALDHFLNAYYDELLAKQTEEKLHSDDPKHGKSIPEEEEDIYEQMQGDQPVGEGGGVIVNYNNGERNMSEDVIKARERLARDKDGRLRKENWVEYLKLQILSQIGRNNSTAFTKPPEDPPLTDFNITQLIQPIFNNTMLDDDQITEKIRSFYPSCDPTQIQEQDQWRESEDMMSLYFDFDFNTDNKNSNIASATLRLYRLPQNITNKVDVSDDCKISESVEEDKLLRVSVYWYTKFQKKRRVKRRLSDSKVVPETSRWVELSVKPATKAWNRAGTKNLGLGILVEDQEGKKLQADKYFKGASCTVGVSTPKPIPTIVRDASHTQADELDRIHSVLGRNSTAAVYSDALLLPTIDICYLEFPQNADISQFNSARINACNLRKMHEDNQRLVERERLERWQALFTPRHIRHQRQHRQSKLNGGDSGTNGHQVSDLESTLRSSMSNKQILFTREELEQFQRDRGLKR